MGWANTRTAAKNRTGYFYTDPKTGKKKEVALHRTVREERMTIKNTHWYPEHIKIECAALYAATHSVEKVHEIQQVPRYAIKKWMKEPWWDNVQKHITKEQNDKLDHMLSGVVHKATEILQDRLENGEIQRTKEGEEIRVPTRIRDATHALEVTFKQRQLLRGEATSRTEAVDSNSKLTQLKDQFEKLAKSKQVNILDPMEGEYVTVSEAGEGPTAGPESFSEGEEPPEGEAGNGSWVEEEVEESSFITS
jgi:hypothetical protein